jgi:hypothetical protein
MNEPLVDSTLALARERLALDREIFAAEVALKKSQKAETGWRSPLVVAILGASAVAAGNAVVAVVNGQLERDLEDRKAESARILQMITADTQQAYDNLTFLTSIGLIKDAQVKEGLKHYLEEEWTESTGPSLSVSSKIYKALLPGSKICITTNSDVAEFSATLLEGTQTIASWLSAELKSKSTCQALPLKTETQYTMLVTLVFTKAGHAKIEAQVVDPTGKNSGKPASFEFDGGRGDVKRTSLNLLPKQ